MFAQYSTFSYTIQHDKYSLRNQRSNRLIGSADQCSSFCDLYITALLGFNTRITQPLQHPPSPFTSSVASIPIFCNSNSRAFESIFPKCYCTSLVWEGSCSAHNLYLACSTISFPFSLAISTSWSFNVVYSSCEAKSTSMTNFESPSG